MTDSDRDARDRTAGNEHRGNLDNPPDPDEQVRDMRHGKGLGGRMLGEEGTTGGTTVGRDLQADMESASTPSDRLPGGHPYDEGMAGRTARGGLGPDLNRDASTPDDEAADENPSPS